LSKVLLQLNQDLLVQLVDFVFCYFSSALVRSALYLFTVVSPCRRVQFVNLVFSLRIMGFRGAGFSLLVLTLCFVISRLRSSEH